jgi:hypothetical protein
MAPSGALGMKAMSAMSAVRTLQLGCQCSGWCWLMDRHSLVPTSKRPLGCVFWPPPRRQRRGKQTGTALVIVIVSSVMADG